MTSDDRLRWRTSTYTGNGENCVEVAPAGDSVLMRDTKDSGAGPVIRFDIDEWATFLSTATGNHMACEAGSVAICEERQLVQYGSSTVLTTWHVRCRSTEATLHFTVGEWSAFLAGASGAEFEFHERPVADLATMAAR